MFSKSYLSAFTVVCLLTAALLNLVLLNSAIAQSKLPRCQGDYLVAHWSNCFGTARFSNGDRFEGEYRETKKHGRGTYYHASGERYEGEWRDNQKNGRGTYYYGSGDRYEGEYRGDKRNGRGTYYYANGKVTTGFWQDENYVGTTALAGNTTSNTTTLQTSSNRVRMVQSGGTFKVPVRLNDQLTLDFMVDSGASDVTVPADVVMTLIRTKTITDSDFRGEQVYVLADGSRVKSRTFILRSLRVGNQTVQNVEASVADIKGSLLLGQSFLRRFKTWSSDNTTNELVLQ